MIILASQSPRREEILKSVIGNLPFKIIPSNFDEDKIDEKDLKKLCLLEAVNKGMIISEKNRDDYIISADTMVYFQGRKLGKPKDKEDAFLTLKELQNNTHEIVTAQCIIKDGKILKESICTSVLFIDKMDDEKIKEYVDTLSPLDKAGSYGIQDEKYISSKIISGERETIMGLCKKQLISDLKSLNII